jgi:hypothetical protein
MGTGGSPRWIVDAALRRDVDHDGSGCDRRRFSETLALAARVDVTSTIPMP